MTSLGQKIVRNFDAAAATYDAAATWQADIAKNLVAWAKPSCHYAASILDIGCGTGMLTQEIGRAWPSAQIVGLDAAPQMLAEVKKKLPRITTILGDAASIHIDQRYDAIFSSMVLHWLPEPVATLQLWRSWLKPQGRLFVALPVQGSFDEWKMLCKNSGINDNLWPLPADNFADDISARQHTRSIKISYEDSAKFLDSMKQTGAFTSSPEKQQMPTIALRKLIRVSPTPFSVHAQIVFLELHAAALAGSGS